MNDIADTMNDKSHSPSEPRPGMSLHKKQVYRWWKDNRGFKKSAFEKPQSTPEHKANRVKCVLRGVIISFRKTFPYVVRMRNGSTWSLAKRDWSTYLSGWMNQKSRILLRSRRMAPGSFLLRSYTSVLLLDRKIFTFEGRQFNGIICLECVSKTPKSREYDKAHTLLAGCTVHLRH